MAVKPITAEFQHFVVEVEGDAPGAYKRICGITQRGISRQHNMQTTEVPGDCEDESLPNVVERAVQSSEVSISGTGVWAAQSHQMMLDWWYSGQKKVIRIRHVNAAVGDTEYETGPAILVNLNNDVEKGQKVTAEIEIQFDGLPERTAKVSGS